MRFILSIVGVGATLLALIMFISIQLNSVQNNLDTLGSNIDELDVAIAALGVAIDSLDMRTKRLDNRVRTLSTNLTDEQPIIIMEEPVVGDGKIRCLFGMFNVQTPDPTAGWSRPALLCGRDLAYHLAGSPPGEVVGPLPPDWSFEPLNEEELKRAGFPPKIEIFN